MLYEIAKLLILCVTHILWRVRVYGAENVPLDGPLIVACNHVSLLDPPLLGAFCPRKLRYMAKKELFKIPVFGPLIRAVGAYPVDRQRSATGAIRRSVEVLRSGGAVGIFPEGGRNLTGDVEARQGVALLASLAKAPVVPAAVVGSRKAALFAPIKVAFGRPMLLDPSRKATREDLAKFTDAVMREIERWRRASMEIRKAKVQGFCFGVAITVKKAEEAIAARDDVTTLGHVVHNPQMVESLAQRGLKNAATVDEVEAGALFVRAHGLPVEVFQKAEEKGLEIIDATCPMVTKIHVQAESLKADGYKIVVIGDPKHPEVKGTLSHVPGAWCIENVEDVEALPRSSQVGVVVQST